WFGPSGLSSLLLILFPVFAGLPGSDRLFAVCSLVVLLSVVIHGTSPMLLARFCKEDKSKVTPPEVPAAAPVAELERAETPVIEPTAATAPAIDETAGEPGAQIITLEEFE